MLATVSSDGRQVTDTVVSHVTVVPGVVGEKRTGHLAATLSPG